MIKSSGHVSLICFAVATVILVSCADQPEPVKEMSSFVGAYSKSQDNLVVLKPPAPKAVSENENKMPTFSRFTEGKAEPAVQKLPPTAALGKTSSSLPTPDISEVIGLNSIALHRLLGKPLLVRREADAEVWQYSNANCVLHLFLYRDQVNKTPFRVAHMEANHRKRANTVQASVDLNFLERKKFAKSCLSRLFNQAKILNKFS